MTITVYGREECVQCDYTKRKLTENGLSYTELDVDKDGTARKVLEDSGKTQLPMVVVERENMPLQIWHGFRIDQIKALAKVA